MVTKEMSDDSLLEEMMYWFRIGRLEGGLRGKDRSHFQEICREIHQRNLLIPPTRLKKRLLDN